MILIAHNTVLCTFQNGADVNLADQGFNDAYYAQIAKGPECVQLLGLSVLRRLLFCVKMRLVRTGVLDNNVKPFNTLFNHFSASRRDLYGDNEICKLL
jgi:hypothetical protein